MKRTTAVGNAGNLYTEGNPSLGVPATVVGASEMNNLQEELCHVVEAAGITLDGANTSQVLAALLTLIQRGGANTSQLEIVNNQVAPANFAGLLFDATYIAAVQIPFAIARATSAGGFVENGRVFLSYDQDALTWRISVTSSLDDAGVKLGVTAQGQVTYTSSNLSGTGYTGLFRVAGVLIFKRN
jgi:hypothetical protein